MSSRWVNRNITKTSPDTLILYLATSRVFCAITRLGVQHITKQAYLKIYNKISSAKVSLLISKGKNQIIGKL